MKDATWSALMPLSNAAYMLLRVMVPTTTSGSRYSMCVNNASSVVSRSPGENATTLKLDSTMSRIVPMPAVTLVALGRVVDDCVTNSSAKDDGQNLGHPTQTREQLPQNGSSHKQRVRGKHTHNVSSSSMTTNPKFFKSENISTLSASSTSATRYASPGTQYPS